MDPRTGRALTPQEYNYARFDAYVEDGDEQAEFAAFADHLHAGQPAPDFTVNRLGDGTTHQIADLWRRKDLVMEFGSFT
ncbi:hypothetical protein BH23ACT9_BH23ACT9_27340 [soil metagenome]